jgi:hypothetical protein
LASGFVGDKTKMLRGKTLKMLVFSIAAAAATATKSAA